MPDTKFMGMALEQMESASHDRMARDPMVHMAGLVLGIVVRPAPGTVAPVRANARRLRLFVQEGVYAKVIKKLRDRLATLRVGNPLDKNTDIGAINSRAQLDKIRELVQSGVDEGADLHQSACALPAKGYWFAPSFLTGVTHAHRVAQEEIFGPVLQVARAKDFDEALALPSQHQGRPDHGPNALGRSGVNKLQSSMQAVRVGQSQNTNSPTACGGDKRRRRGHAFHE